MRHAARVHVRRKLLKHHSATNHYGGKYGGCCECRNRPLARHRNNRSRGGFPTSLGQRRCGHFVPVIRRTENHVYQMRRDNLSAHIVGNGRHIEDIEQFVRHCFMQDMIMRGANQGRAIAQHSRHLAGFRIFRQQHFNQHCGFDI